MNKNIKLSKPKPLFNHHRPVLMVTWGIGEKFGGMTAVCLKKAGSFHDNGTPSAIVTFDANPDLQLRIDEVVSHGRLSAEIPIINFHDYYSNNDNISNISTENIINWEKFEWLETEDPIRRNDGSLFRTMRETSEEEGTKRQDYYRRDGSCYLIDVVSEAGVVKRNLQLVSRAGDITKVFSSAAAMYRDWLSLLVGDDEIDVIVDSKYAASFLATWKSAKSCKATVFHSTHVKPGSDPLTGPLADGYKETIARRNDWDIITFLTNTQKKDFISRFGNQGNLKQISNPIEKQEHLPDSNERNSNKIVFVGRLTKSKNVDQAIRIIYGLRDAGFPVTLDIMGEGSSRSSLEDLTRQLGVESHVTFLGHAPDVRKRLSVAGFLLLCSDFEGAPLVLVEAMGSGCVPVSYDANYGPSDMIKHNSTGVLIPHGDVAEAIRAIASLLEDPQRREKISESAFKAADEYRGTRVHARWIQAFAEARAAREGVDYGSDVSVSLERIVISADGSLEVDVNVMGFLGGSIGRANFGVVLEGRDSRCVEYMAPELIRWNPSGFTVRLPNDAGSFRQNKEALDLSVVLRVNAREYFLRVGGSKRLSVTPYLTVYGNVSFK